MRDLTIVLPHFRNLGMLAEQQRIWASYPASVRARLHVIVVDDCSPQGACPTSTSVTADGLSSFRMYRLLEKKRWNWLACRNLGAKLATTEWLLLTDIDHTVPVETMTRVLDGPLNPRDAYRFKRVTAPSQWPYDVSTAAWWKPHNDTWLLTRPMFFNDRVGGYDERLSGCYGTSGEFKDRLQAATRAIVLLDQVIVRYPREVIPDASTPPDLYTRKNDPENDQHLAELKQARAKIPGWKPLHGLCPYETIYESGVPCVA